MASTQKIINETVMLLAEHYSFDAKEALEYVLNAAKKAESPAFARANKAADATRAKIAELEQKIADKKVKNAEKSAETLAGLRAKLEEQMTRVAKFDTADVTEDETMPKKKRATKKKTEDVPAPAPVPEEEAVVPAPAPEPVPEEAPAPVPEEEAVVPAPAPEPVPEEAPAPKKKASKKKEEPAKEKRIARMTPTLNKQLKSTFDDAKIEFKDEHKKAFATFINDMTDDAFGTKSLPDHMRDFVGTFKDAPVADDAPPTEAPTDKKQIVKVTHDELLAATLVDSYGPGVYWDVTNKRFVRGPAAVADEDVTEMLFEGSAYVVGDVSKRVYLVGEADVFTGFVGVGKFKTMVVA